MMPSYPNTKLLAICTSFRRPHMLPDMLKSFYATKNDDTDIFIYLHEDDPRLEEYLAYIDKYPHFIGQHLNMQQLINHVVFNLYPGTPFYEVICDDHIYHTPNWDHILEENIMRRANGWGFCCGRDLINGDNWMQFQHPSAEIWSWKFCSTLGYAYPKGFNAQGLDYYAKDMALSINALTFVPEVVIEHLWYGNCGRPEDENIKEKYNEKSFEEARTAFKYWQENEKQEAIDRVNKARELERINNA